MTLEELQMRAENDQLLIGVIGAMENIMSYYQDINNVVLRIESDNPDMSWKTHGHMGTICERASRMRNEAEEIFVSLARMMTCEYVSKEVNEKFYEMAYRLSQND